MQSVLPSSFLPAYLVAVYAVIVAVYAVMVAMVIMAIAMSPDAEAYSSPVKITLSAYGDAPLYEELSGLHDTLAVHPDLSGLRLHGHTIHVTEIPPGYSYDTYAEMTFYAEGGNATAVELAVESFGWWAKARAEPVSLVDITADLHLDALHVKVSVANGADSPVDYGAARLIVGGYELDRTQECVQCGDFWEGITLEPLSTRNATLVFERPGLGGDIFWAGPGVTPVAMLTTETLPPDGTTLRDFYTIPVVRGPD